MAGQIHIITDPDELPDSSGAPVSTEPRPKGPNLTAPTPPAPTAMQPSDGPGPVESLGRGVAQGGTFGLEDELQGAVMAYLQGTRRADARIAQALGIKVDPANAGETDQNGQPLSPVDVYREYRDGERGRNAQAAKDHTGLYVGGNVLGGVATGKLLPTAATGLGRVATGAGVGTAYSAGNSDADLTRGQVGQFAKDASGVSGVQQAAQDYSDGHPFVAGLDAMGAGPVGGAGTAALVEGGGAAFKGLTKGAYAGARQGVSDSLESAAKNEEFKRASALYAQAKQEVAALQSKAEEAMATHEANWKQAQAQYEQAKAQLAKLDGEFKSKYAGQQQLEAVKAQRQSDLEQELAARQRAHDSGEQDRWRQEQGAVNKNQADIANTKKVAGQNIANAIGNSELEQVAAEQARIPARVQGKLGGARSAQMTSVNNVLNAAEHGAGDISPEIAEKTKIALARSLRDPELETRLGENYPENEAAAHKAELEEDLARRARLAKAKAEFKSQVPDQLPKPLPPSDLYAHEDLMRELTSLQTRPKLAPMGPLPSELGPLAKPVEPPRPFDPVANARMNALKNMQKPSIETTSVPKPLPEDINAAIAKARNPIRPALGGVMDKGHGAMVGAGVLGSILGHGSAGAEAAGLGLTALSLGHGAVEGLQNDPASMARLLDPRNVDLRGAGASTSALALPSLRKVMSSSNPAVEHFKQAQQNPAYAQHALKRGEE